jgi:murein DD-endopeptidase MepM/ murein hydrolase activator NlpD
VKDRQFTLWFLSEHDGKQRSFQFSKFFLKFISIFGIIILLLASFGLWQVLGRNSLLQELNKLNKYKDRTDILLNELNAEKRVMEENLENSIRSFFSDNGEVLPINPPVNGIVTKGIEKKGKKITHSGIDIAAEFGAKISSPLDGFVVFSGVSEKFENLVVISHTHGIYSLYGHNKKNLVKEREFVRAGQKIATVGKSKNSEGPHLHFEMWKNDEILDPRNFIELYKTRDVSIQ